MRYAIVYDNGSFSIGNSPMEGEFIAECLPILASAPPAFDPRYQHLFGPTYARDGDVFIENWVVYDEVLSVSANNAIAEIKRQAGAEILATWPMWKQNNLLAESAELLRARLEAPWTEAQAARVLELEAIWEEIRGIRAVSDVREAAVHAATTGEDVCRVLDTPHPGQPGFAWSPTTQSWVPGA